MEIVMEFEELKRVRTLLMQLLYIVVTICLLIG